MVNFALLNRTQWLFVVVTRSNRRMFNMYGDSIAVDLYDSDCLLFERFTLTHLFVKHRIKQPMMIFFSSYVLCWTNFAAFQQAKIFKNVNVLIWKIHKFQESAQLKINLSFTYMGVVRITVRGGQATSTIYSRIYTISALFLHVTFNYEGHLPPLVFTVS